MQREEQGAGRRGRVWPQRIIWGALILLTAAALLLGNQLYRRYLLATAIPATSAGEVGVHSGETLLLNAEVSYTGQSFVRASYAGYGDASWEYHLYYVHLEDGDMLLVSDEVLAEGTQQLITTTSPTRRFSELRVMDIAADRAQPELTLTDTDIAARHARFTIVLLGGLIAVWALAAVGVFIRKRAVRARVRARQKHSPPV